MGRATPMLYEWMKSEGRVFTEYLSRQPESETSRAFLEVTATYVVIQNSSRVNFFCFPVHELVATVRALSWVVGEEPARWPMPYDESVFRALGAQLRSRSDWQAAPVVLTQWGVQSKSVYLMLVAFISWVNGDGLDPISGATARAIDSAAARLGLY